MAELYALSRSKLKPSDLMVKFCNTLIDTEALLDGIAQGDYLRHPREVAALEDLLPTAEAQEFIRRDARLQGNQFEKLRAFLMERKAEIQKLDKLGTKSRSDLTDSNTDDKPTRNKGCFRCGGDHLIKDCDKSEGDKNFKGKKGRGKINHGEANPSGQEVQTNTFRSTNCRRCKRANQSPKPCPGCTLSLIHI